MLRFGGVSRRGELGAWRLARSIREAGRAGAIVPTLALMAADPALDDYNRLRATAVAVLASDDESVVDQRTLPDAALAWLAERRAAQRSP